MTYLTSVGGGVADGGSTTHDSPTLTVSGTNKVMWVLVGNSDSSPATPSGVVWDPTGANESLTQIGTGITYATFGNASLWRRIAPTNVTNGIVRVTWGSAKGERIVGVWVETGIDQTTPNGTVSQGSVNTSTSPINSTALSTTTGQRVLQFAHAIFTSAGAIGFNSPSGTERVDAVTTGGAYDNLAIQEQTASGSSTQPQWGAMTNGEDGWATFSIALNDASAGSSAALGGSAGTTNVGTAGNSREIAL
jgi:hypothetical protein